MLTHVIVTYNHAPYVEKAILSALQQTVPSRLVVVDDASKDDTRAVIRRVLEREGSDALFIAPELNQGLTASLNAGLREVTTPYMAYFAGDDWVEPDRAEVQVGLMEARGEAFVLSYGDCLRSNEKGDPFDLLFSERHPRSWQTAEGDIFGALLRGPNWLPAPTLMQRTDALRAIGGYDEALDYEDYDICLRLARVGKVARTETPLATHREHAASLGAEIFKSGSSRWLRNLVDIERKHLGASPATDHLVAMRLRERVLKLYELGSDPKWVNERLIETLPYLAGSESRTIRGLRSAARLGVPASALRRLKTLPKALRGQRRRVARTPSETTIA
ncbi:MULTISPECIES: glycosyltransferase family 2 protein [unclassified Pseudoclavibacter]|uniref:glycosyltransferase family 2 protein n=1 Tax=unclassified Pseudoclavibacter TaxID=2615177 RepID=UPI001BABBAF6|nr:glycosyltransferase family A protein [Pseudoclavibacter sp. Marseille-Q4354]MBS3180156.1 glycosyltransferase family 2 protein [Pseudoclavibacter sp. Marseille-Q4354]